LIIDIPEAVVFEVGRKRLFAVLEATVGTRLENE
jgi:hypothetical protein